MIDKRYLPNLTVRCLQLLYHDLTGMIWALCVSSFSRKPNWWKVDNLKFSFIFTVWTTSSKERLLHPKARNGPGYVAQPTGYCSAHVRGTVRFPGYARHVHDVHPAANPGVRRYQQGNDRKCYRRRAAQQCRTDEATAICDPLEVKSRDQQEIKMWARTHFLHFLQISNVSLRKALAAYRHPVVDLPSHRLWYGRGPRQEPPGGTKRAQGGHHCTGESQI